MHPEPQKLSPPAFWPIAALLALVGLWFLLYVGEETSRSIDKDYFLAKVKQMAGEGAVACGELRVGNDHNPSDSNACPRAALQSAKPFWVAYRIDFEETQWLALVRNKDGNLWQVYFDPDVYGSNGKSPNRQPYLSTHVCPHIELPDSAAIPECTAVAN